MVNHIYSKDVKNARSKTLWLLPKERELELVNALMEIRSVSPSGSYEMGVIDEALGKLGYTPWKAIIKKGGK